MYAKNNVPLYDGDGYLHAGPVSGAESRGAPLARLNYIEIERKAHRLRGEAMAELFGRLYARVRAKLGRRRNSALEDYLARSSSLADVERRLRDAERDGRYFTG